MAESPTIHINCKQSTIYVNNIINTPQGSSLTFPMILGLESGDKNTDDKNPGSQSHPVAYNLKEGGSIQIFCDPNKEAGPFKPSRTKKPIAIVEFNKLSSKGTSEMPAYVITIHKNNVPGEESRTAIDHIIKAENVILNSLGALNVGPGAGAKNKGPAAGSSNNFNFSSANHKDRRANQNSRITKDS